MGGFTKRDNEGVSSNVWNFMMGPLAIKSFIDLGCGKGVSTKYFMDNGKTVDSATGTIVVECRETMITYTHMVLVGC